MKIKTITRERKNRVLYYAIISRIGTIIISILTAILLPEFDNSSKILVSGPHRALLRYDAIYFLNIAKNNDYIFENEMAFFPLLPILSRLLSKCLIPFLPRLSELSLLFLSGIIISNICFILASLMLYKVCLKLFDDESIAYKAAILFCFTPCPGFMSSMYTESLFAFLTFSGMYYYLNDNIWWAACFWCLSSFTRSNGILYSGYIIYNQIFLNPWKNLSWMKKGYGFISMLLQILLVCSGYLLFQYYGYLQFCKTEEFVTPWCKYTIPWSYQYIQKHYWNCGFLSYYELRQLPNFLLALPFIFISVHGIYEYANSNRLEFFSLGLLKREEKKDKSKQYNAYLDNNNLLPHIYLWGFMLMYVCLFMHVQVILRFFTSVPIFYAFIAYKLSSKNNLLFKNFITYYWFFYGLISIILFAAFLPPA